MVGILVAIHILVYLMKEYEEYELDVRKNCPFSAGTDFRRQNLTSVAVRFWRLKSIPALNMPRE